MATEISNGNQTVKLYRSVNRGKAMYQIAYYAAGKRIQKNFRDKSKAKRTADQILRGLTLDAKSVDSLLTPDLESLVAARKALAPSYALHVAVEEHAQAVSRLGKTTLREAVEFFLRHNRADVPRLTLAQAGEQFAKSREQAGLSVHYINQCRKTLSDLSKVFAGLALLDLRTAELDAWLGGLPFAPKTKNGIRIILVACGNWAEGRGYLVKGSSPFPAMVRYKETKSAVSLFTPNKSPVFLPRPTRRCDRSWPLERSRVCGWLSCNGSIGAKLIWSAVLSRWRQARPKPANAAWCRSRTISKPG